MNSDFFDRLRPIGLAPAHAHAQALLQAATALPAAHRDAHPARVTEVHRETTVVDDGLAVTAARLHPHVAHLLSAGDEALAVGDWVLLWHDAHGSAWIVARAEPLTRIVRRNADGLRHVVVSNVDTALLVMGLDGDYNPRRLERFVALVRADPGIAPVVVLTKRDWAGDAVALDEAEHLTRRLGGALPVHAVNGLDPASAVVLAPWLGAGRTAVLLGSSGAGKSTLTNTLVGHNVMDTGAVRAADSRGKHTTTHRALYRLPGGGCVIDTPGVRTLRPDLDAEALAASFEDIATLAAECRFRDCTHQQEPGCAVRAAVDADRLANWHKLGRELKRDSMTLLERQRQLAEWKARSRGGRERLKLKRGE